jgi:hypothetical protein
MGFLELLFGPPRPKEGDQIEVRDSGERGTIVAVERNGFGFFETFATCSVRHHSDRSVLSEHREDKLDFINRCC